MPVFPTFCCTRSSSAIRQAWPTSPLSEASAEWRWTLPVPPSAPGCSHGCPGLHRQPELLSESAFIHNSKERALSGWLLPRLPGAARTARTPLGKRLQTQLKDTALSGWLLPRLPGAARIARTPPEKVSSETKESAPTIPSFSRGDLEW